MHLKSQPKLLIVLGILFAIIFVALALYLSNSDNVSDGTSDTTGAEDVVSTDEQLPPETIEEEPEVKQEDANATETVSSADVVITAYRSGESIIARAYVSNLVEEDGRCTFVVKDKASNVVANKVVTAAANVSTTECGSQSFDMSSLPSATYSVSVSYQSSANQGQSDEVGVDYE